MVAEWWNFSSSDGPYLFAEAVWVGCLAVLGIYYVGEKIVNWIGDAIDDTTDTPSNIDDADNAINKDDLIVSESKQSGKERATDKPSWVNRGMVDKNKSAQENAKAMLDVKYGKGKWKKGPNNEFNKIVKWIIRSHILKEVIGHIIDDRNGMRIF